MHEFSTFWHWYILLWGEGLNDNVGTVTAADLALARLAFGVLNPSEVGFAAKADGVSGASSMSKRLLTCISKYFSIHVAQYKSEQNQDELTSFLCKWCCRSEVGRSAAAPWGRVGVVVLFSNMHILGAHILDEFGADCGVDRACLSSTLIFFVKLPRPCYKSWQHKEDFRNKKKVLPVALNFTSRWEMSSDKFRIKSKLHGFKWWPTTLNLRGLVWSFSWHFNIHSLQLLLEWDKEITCKHFQNNLLLVNIRFLILHKYNSALL